MRGLKDDARGTINRHSGRTHHRNEPASDKTKTVNRESLTVEINLIIKECGIIY